MSYESITFKGAIAFGVLWFVFFRLASSKKDPITGRVPARIEAICGCMAFLALFARAVYEAKNMFIAGKLLTRDGLIGLLVAVFILLILLGFVYVSLGRDRKANGDFETCKNLCLAGRFFALLGLVPLFLGLLIALTIGLPSF